MAALSRSPFASDRLRSQPHALLPRSALGVRAKQQRRERFVSATSNVWRMFASRPSLWVSEVQYRSRGGSAASLRTIMTAGPMAAGGDCGRRRCGHGVCNGAEGEGNPLRRCRGERRPRRARPHRQGEPPAFHDAPATRPPGRSSLCASSSDPTGDPLLPTLCPHSATLRVNGAGRRLPARPGLPDFPHFLPRSSTTAGLQAARSSAVLPPAASCASTEASTCKRAQTSPRIAQSRPRGRVCADGALLRAASRIRSAARSTRSPPSSQTTRSGPPNSDPPHAPARAPLRGKPRPPRAPVLHPRAPPPRPLTVRARSVRSSIVDKLLIGVLRLQARPVPRVTRARAHGMAHAQRARAVWAGGDRRAGRAVPPPRHPDRGAPGVRRLLRHGLLRRHGRPLLPALSRRHLLRQQAAHQRARARLCLPHARLWRELSPAQRAPSTLPRLTLRPPGALPVRALSRLL